LLKKSFDLNRDLNHWFKSPWFKSANPDHGVSCSAVRHCGVISCFQSTEKFARRIWHPTTKTQASWSL